MTHNMQDRTVGWLFEHVMKPSHRGPQSAKMLAATAEAVKLLHTFHGCDPPASDITSRLLKDFAGFLRLRGDAVNMVHRRCERIKEIVDLVIPSLPDPCEHEPTAGTMREFLETRFVSLAGAPAGRGMKLLRQAVNRYCRACNCDVLMADVTPEDIDEFEETLGNNYFCRIVGGKLRTIMRAYDPVRFRRRSKMPARDPSPADASRWLLWNIYKDYQASRGRTWRDNTRRLYRASLVAFERHLGRRATLDDLNDDELNAFAVTRGRDVVKSTVNRDLENLSAMWRWCADKCIVDTRPTIEMEKVPRRVPVAWQERDMLKLMATIRELPGRVGIHQSRDWWSALIHVLWDSGERIAPVMALDWSRVDLRRRWIVFVAEDRKGGIEDNAVSLSDETVEALRRIHADAGPVFPWPLNAKYLWKRFSDILERAGLPNDRQSKFHRIRKTVGSYVEAAGGNATAVLRHSDRRVTEKYLDPTIVKRQQPADVLFRLTGKNAIRSNGRPR